MNPPVCSQARGRSDRSACKPHSVRRWSRLDGHLSEQPTRGYGSISGAGRRAASLDRWSSIYEWWVETQQSTILNPLTPAWPCSRWGLPGRPHCWGRRWSLTPPFHPCGL